jgi:hypothetical protein
VATVIGVKISWVLLKYVYSNLFNTSRENIGKCCFLYQFCCITSLNFSRVPFQPCKWLNDSSRPTFNTISHK